jgi:flagellar hook-basal body complex protein FliE
MSTITSIASSALGLGVQPLPSVTPTAGADFGSVLKTAVQGVDSYQHQANQAIGQFLQGNGELHNVALSTQRAEMAFDLAVQIRNKVISAYQEIMKLQL